MKAWALAFSFLLATTGIAGPSITPGEKGLNPAVVRFLEALPAMEGQAFEQVELTIGHSRIFFETGHAAPLMAGNASPGLFFVGKGYLEYTSKEPSEFAVIDFNLDNISGPKPSGGGDYKTIRVRFEELSLFAHGWDLPEISRRIPRDLLSAYKDQHSYLQRLDGPSMIHSLVMGSMNSPAKPVALLHLSGKDGNWVYHYDSASLQEERLLAGRPVDRDFEVARVATISRQPIGWAFRKGKEALLTLTDVQMELTTDNQRDVRINVEETLVPAKDGMKALHLELVSRLFTQLGRGVEARHLAVLGITDARGNSVPFHHHQDSLLLFLPQSLPAGVPAKFRFQLEGNILVQPNGDNYWALTTYAWFPQPDMGGQFYSARCKMKVRKPFTPIASGDWVRRAEEGDFNILESEIKKPVQFFTVIAGKYTIDEKTENGLTIRAASYALVGANGKNLINLAHEMIRHYQTLLGPFPFKEYNIVQINNWGWGQAPPGLMLITNEAFTRRPTLERLYFSKDVNARFAHEIAHAYWGHVVKMPSLEEQWITEAFSEYASALMIRIAKNEGYYEKMARQMAFDGEDSTKRASIPSANLLFSRDYVTASLHRQNLLYSKGAYLLYCLHKELGDKNFILFLRSYQASFRWKFGSTEHIVGLLNYITKKDYSPFFEKYFWGVGFPPPPKP